MEPSMQTHFQEQDVPMTCRLNFLYFYFLYWEHALQSEVPSRGFALCNLLVPHSLNRFERLFQSIYNCSLPEFFGHQRNNPVERLFSVFIWILINNKPGTHWIAADWATELVWTFRKKEKILAFFGIRTPDRPTCSAVTILLSLHDAMVQHQSGIMGLFLEEITVTHSVKELCFLRNSVDKNGSRAVDSLPWETVVLYVPGTCRLQAEGLRFIGPCIVIYFSSKTNKMHHCIKCILFWNDTLHVSDGLSVHRQEFKTVHTATGICHTAVCLLQAVGSVWHMPVAVSIVLNSWWWTERPSETCRV